MCTDQARTDTEEAVTRLKVEEEVVVLQVTMVLG